jgi:endonuclease YncB( thermonuclease family)
VATAILACLIFAPLNVPVRAELSGAAGKIVDGDTLWVCNDLECQKFRICGINAPEAGRPGYAEARDALSNFVKGHTMRCVQVGGGTPCDGRSKPFNRDRIVAQCFADGEDVATYLVKRGYACDWVKFSGGHYSRDGTGTVCPISLKELPAPQAHSQPLHEDYYD